MEPPISVPAVPADKVDFDLDFTGSVGEGPYGRATNMQLIPLKNMIRAVCF